MLSSISYLQEWPIWCRALLITFLGWIFISQMLPLLLQIIFILLRLLWRSIYIVIGWGILGLLTKIFGILIKPVASIFSLMARAIDDFLTSIKAIIHSKKGKIAGLLFLAFTLISFFIALPFLTYIPPESPLLEPFKFYSLLDSMIFF